jgi:hypothetical protein
MITYIKANWKQIVTLAVSAGVAALLHVHKITIDEAILVGSVCATLGIQLMPIGFASNASVAHAVTVLAAHDQEVTQSGTKEPQS